MARRVLLATVALAAVGLATPALAAPPTCTALPFTAGSTTYNECTYSNGSQFFTQPISNGWNYAASGPVALSADVLGDLNVNVIASVLPAGASTSTLQQSEITALGALSTTLQSGIPVSGPLTASQLGLAGLATAAAQATSTTTAHADAQAVVSAIGGISGGGSGLTNTQLQGDGLATTALQTSLGAQAHTDAQAITTAVGALAVPASLTNTQLQSDNLATSALQTSTGAQAHTDAGTAHTDAQAITSAIGGLSTPAGLTNTQLQADGLATSALQSSIATSAHQDATQAHADAGLESSAANQVTYGNQAHADAALQSTAALQALGNTSTAATAAAAGTPADAAYTGSNAATLISLLKANLTAIQALLTGPLNMAGSVQFAGQLPAYAATPTFNLGALNGAALDSSLQAIKTALGTPLQAGGAVTVSGVSNSANQTAAATQAHTDAQAILAGPLNMAGSVAFTGSMPCNVVSADQTFTAGSPQGCTMTPTGRIKVGLSSAATVGATGSTTSDLAGFLDPSGNQQPLHLNADGGAPTHVTNFPTTQPVSGSVSVTNLPATQSVSGSVTANLGTLNGAALASNQTSEITQLTNANGLLNQISTNAAISAAAAATNGAAAASTSGLTGATDPAGKQQSLQVDVNKSLKIARVAVPYAETLISVPAATWTAAYTGSVTTQKVIIGDPGGLGCRFSVASAPTSSQGIPFSTTSAPGSQEFADPPPSNTLKVYCASAGSVTVEAF